MCGIAAIKLKDKSRVGQFDVLKMLADVLYQMTHRGQEGAGFVWPYHNRLEVYKNFGYAEEVYTQILAHYADKLDKLVTYQALGHVRYPTEGSSLREDLQPTTASSVFGRVFALADNGNLVNYQQERELMEGAGMRFGFSSNNEAELILHAIIVHHYYERIKKNGGEADFIKSIEYALKYFRGAFSTILMTRNNIFAFVDRFGFRPLILGETEDFWVLASESCALDILHIPSQRRTELQAGQICHLSDEGVEWYQVEDINPKKCIFEYVYFARPDSVLWGRPVYRYRENLGKILASYDKDLQVNIVMPVPDSANFIAYGYALAKGLSLAQFMPWALIRNHYVGRTFIKPGQTVRDESVRKKFNPLPGIFKGQRVVVIDDSIVRGTTILKIIKMIFQAGAKEVHLRIGSPPKKAPCYYAIASSTQEEHAWHKYGGLAGIVNYLKKEVSPYMSQGAKFTVKYLSHQDLRKTVDKPEDYCLACFDGKYPVK